MSPQENFLKFGTLRSLLRSCLGHKSYQNLPIYSFCRQKSDRTELPEISATHDAHFSPFQFARSSRAQVIAIENLEASILSSLLWMLEDLKTSQTPQATVKRSERTFYNAVRIQATPFFFLKKPVRPWPYRPYRPYRCRPWEVDLNSCQCMTSTLYQLKNEVPAMLLHTE